jgi:hypothetical protein
MGPTDSRRPDHPAHGSPLSSLGHPVSPLGDGEASAAPFHLDPREDWESAWIDLGGEG